MDKYDRRPAVFQNNALIDCKNRTMNEKQTKLYYLGLRKMVSDLPNSSQEKRPEFTGSLMVYIPKSELVSRFGAKWVQNDLYKEVDVMMSKAKIKIKDDNGKWALFNIFSYVTYEGEKLTIKFSDDIAPYVLHLTKGCFTKVPLDDVMKLKRKQNEGLTEIQKLFGQVIIAVVFFYIYMKSGSEPLLWFHAFNLKVDVGWLYGFFILFMLVASSNAVNITDGLDGLAGGLSFIATLVLGIISWSTNWLAGYQDIAIFCFILAGSILGFLVYNTYPAKVFMGDTGSLAIGGVLAAIAILTRHELTFAVIMGVFVIETLSVIIQVFSIFVFKKKVFLMTPLHHNFEKLGWKEQDIVKLFWIVGLILGTAAVIYGAWL